MYIFHITYKNRHQDKVYKHYKIKISNVIHVKMNTIMGDLIGLGCYINALLSLF